jgi:hypothetical protein
MEKENLSFRDRNQKKIEELLQKEDVANIRAIAAHTIEVKNILNKISLLDIVANNIRNQMGFKISFEEGAEMLKDFKEIEDSIQSLIDKAAEKEIFRKRENKKQSLFQTYKDEIKQMLVDNHSEEDIIKSLLSKDDTTEQNVIKSWIGVIKADMK